MITVTYTSLHKAICDGRWLKTRRFLADELDEARKFAHTWIGPHPAVGSYYAVSFSGAHRIEWLGTTGAELFPPPGVRL